MASKIRSRSPDKIPITGRISRWNWHVAAFILLALPSALGRNSPRQQTIPRSPSRRRHSDHPAWNPSEKIDDDGFLRGWFRRSRGDWEKEVRLRTSYRTDLPCQIRQVPGDGNCLFHSLSLCLQHAVNGTHWDMSNKLEDLFHHSRSLRREAVDCLLQTDRRLFLQGHETLSSHDLVTAAAEQYKLTPEEYCAAMEQEGVWGGGPEIVALSNVLQRPIHVYELAVCNEEEENHKKSRDEPSKKGSKPAFVLRRMACFGSPRFDRNTPLHILSADSRFPDVQPGEQLAAGNHFLAIFPQIQSRGRKRIRGGGEHIDATTAPPHQVICWLSQRWQEFLVCMDL